MRLFYSYSMRSFFLLLLVVGCLAGHGIAYDFAGGTGEPNDPYQISTAQQLIDIGPDPNLLNKYYVLLNNIDLDPNLEHGQVFEQALIAPDLDDTADGFQGTPFSGTFDGNGYHISNPEVLDKQDDHFLGYLGLFGKTAQEAHIMRLGVVNARVIGLRNHIGILVGMNSGMITGCYTEGFVSGNSDIGGLVGVNENGSLLHCLSMAEVGGSSSMGGLIGVNRDGNISYCCSTGSVIGNGDRYGGLVGINSYGHISNSYSTGMVSADDHVGGLVGRNYYGSILNCYSTGSVNGGQRGTGGLVGNNDNGEISNCYSTGTVSGSNYVGGLVGSHNDDSVLNCFWNRSTSNQPYSYGGTGLYTTQMQDIDTFLDAGWDFIDETDNGTEDIWYMPIDGYPQLVPFAGLGIPEDPYRIETAWQLTSIASEPNLLDKYYVLVSHIDLDPNLPVSRVFDWAVIAAHGMSSEFSDTVFTGLLNGNGFTIKNLIIQGEGYLGLFGFVGQGAVIRDLGVVDANVTNLGMASNNGILAGFNHGEVSTCFCTGTIQANINVGGFVGFNDGNMLNCYSRSTVRGNIGIGGFVGSNGSHGIVSNCYSTGGVSGNMEVGGLVGSNAGGVSNSFWDMDTSGQSSSAHGMGLSTSQMQDINTFLDAGWDFIDNTINGTEDIWRMPVNNYPGLWWQDPNAQ